MLLKCCTQYASKFGTLSSGHKTWKVSFIPVPKKGNAKECSNYHTIALISYASKVMLKILQARLQQYMDHELPDVQAGFRKGRGTRDQIANICWIIKEAREFQKNIYFCFIDYAKAFDCVDHNKLWKILTITLLVCARWAKLCGSLNIIWHCLSLGLEWKLTFSSPVATAELQSTQ